MAYMIMDDGFYDHPKIVALSPDAFRAHVMAMGYAQRHLTDGYVPKNIAPGLAIVRELIKANLWEPSDDGWRIHDWLDWNTPASVVKARREAARERQRRWRRNARGQYETRDSQGTSTGVDGSVTHDETQDETQDETGDETRD